VSNKSGFQFWARVTAGLVLGFGLFQGSARWLGSDRGQAGLQVAGVVLLATLLIQLVLFGQRPIAAIRWLGITRTSGRGILAALLVCVLLLLVIPAFAAMTGATVSWYPGWAMLLPGLFAQGGIAEEVLFRGYLFGHARDGRSFWSAVILSMVPFIAVHLVLFLSLPWPLAFAAVVLAAAISPPLAHLFELGCRSIWPPALVHFVSQGTIKVVMLSGETGFRFPLTWMLGCATLPYLVFLARSPVIAPTRPELGSDGERRSNQ
jgi:membrane protease YdiL (CAAX protease family)